MYRYRPGFMLGVRLMYLDRLDEAVREGLLAEVPGAINRFRFSHDLVREVLYEELSSAQRVRFHRRAADALDEEVRTSVEIMASVLEPAMILLMAGVVLFVVLAVLLPVFEMNQLVR